jgi:hypothetical protein
MQDFYFGFSDVASDLFLFFGLTPFPIIRIDLPVGLFCRGPCHQFALAAGATQPLSPSQSRSKLPK